MLNPWKSGYVAMTPARRKLLSLLSDGKWKRKFPGVGVKTFETLRELGFLRIRFINKKGHGKIEAKITTSGRIFLRTSSYVRLVLME